MSNVKCVKQVPKGKPFGWPDKMPEILQAVLAHRGVLCPADYTKQLKDLYSPKTLGGIDRAAEIIAAAIEQQLIITIAGDYDCDGATGTSVLYRGLKLLGAENVLYVLPNRFKHGYGLSPLLVDDMDPRTQLVVTVDSGTSSVEGVARAKELGRQVVITDHHLQGDTLPNADAIVNPNLIGETFPVKSLAGVGVAFYVLMATRAYMRDQGKWTGTDVPDLVELLDLVAIGTVADLVPLERDNRILVSAGLRLIQQGRASPGVRALIRAAKKDPHTLTATDIAFAIAPRLNAAGRLEDMTIGVQTLTALSLPSGDALAAQLEEINSQRRTIQAEMIDEANAKVATLAVDLSEGVVVYDPSWHSGIVGLVASKLKESLHRPVIALAPAESGSTELRGSARSVEGFHLRDALALVDTRYPGLMKKFGGHAMAAGLSMDIQHVDAFKAAFAEISKEMLTEDMLQAVLRVDGTLPVGAFTEEFALELERLGPWGQAFPTPIFEGLFEVVSCQVLAEKHFKFELMDVRDGARVAGIYFNAVGRIPPEGTLHLVFELNLNRWKQWVTPQLLIRHASVFPF